MADITDSATFTAWVEEQIAWLEALASDANIPAARSGTLNGEYYRGVTFGLRKAADRLRNQLKGKTDGD